MPKTAIFAAAALCLSGAAVSAASVSPVSYSMQNGETGSYTYWDDSYNAPGAPTTTSKAFLSGGVGDLTDGVIATQNWNSTPGPYVGWVSISPRISFFFGQVWDFTSVTFHFDDSNGTGGVRTPQKVEVNDSFLSYVTDPGGSAPIAHTINLASVAPTNTLVFDIFAQNSSWIMLSEVTFDAAPVPIPASGLLLLGELGGFAAWRRKRA